ncbi:MAG: hypothetical protein IT331_13510 [Anaerolineae bacterium]|nr:hypothetical protein [Anaerolineae bacterium]
MNRVLKWMTEPKSRSRALSVMWAAMMFTVIVADASAQGGDLGGAMSNLAKLLVDALIALAALLLAIGFATNFVTGMAETIAGRPMGLSSTWVRLGGILIAFVGAIFTIQIANTIIDTLAAYKSTDSIHLP